MSDRSPQLEKYGGPLRGTVKPPLSWAYAVTMDQADGVGFFDVALGPAVVRYLLHPRRWPLALRAGWHFGAFLCAYAIALIRHT